MSWITRQLGSGQPLISYDRRYQMSSRYGYKRYPYSKSGPRKRTRYNPRSRSTWSAKGKGLVIPRMSSSRRGYGRTSGYYGRFTSGGERKFHDIVVDDAPVPTALTIFNLTVIAEGNGESERIGRKITIKQISCNYSMQLTGGTAATDTSDTVNIMIIQDRQTNGAQFVALDLKETDNIISFNNLANSKRFKTLYSQDYSLAAGGAAPSGAALIFSEDRAFVRMNLNVNIPIEYDNSATSGVITSVRSNNIYFVTRSSSAVVSTIGRVRIRYTDL